MKVLSTKIDQKTKPKIIRSLNIDPAISVLGWSITDRSSTGSKVLVVRWGNLTPGSVAAKALNREECDKYTKRMISLREVRNGIRDLITEYQPDYITIEDNFFNSRYPSAYCALEQVITTIALVCMDEFHKRIFRIPTKCAKQAVTTTGDAKKNSVLSAILDSEIITFKQKRKSEELDHHSADSIAVGVHFLCRVWPELEHETQEEING